MASINTVFRDEFTPFEIDSITYEDDASGSTPSNITFEFDNAMLALDMSGRFTKHEIIGGSTVRQKIGEDPINVSIDGVCFEETGTELIQLRDAKRGIIYSNQLPNGALEVQFASASVTPLDEGGAVDLTEGRFLYEFSLNCIEIGSASNATTGIDEEGTTSQSGSGDGGSDGVFTATSEDQQAGDVIIDPETGEIIDPDEEDNE